MTPSLEMRHITKRFPGVTANDDVSLTLYPGEIHALLGENGAGKSTLMNILNGIYSPDEGEIIYNGELIKINNPAKAVSYGIGMVHQHFKLIETMTVAENIYLAVGKRCDYVLNRRKMERQILEYSRSYNLEVRPDAKIYELSVGEQQRVEIVKQLFRNANLLVLDEPTAVLTPQETDKLFENLRAMAKEGKTILFITHKLFEVMEYSDRITVLRQGKSVNTLLTKDTTQDELVKMMVGRKVEKMPGNRPVFADKKPVLVLKNIQALNDKGLPALKNFDMTLYSGEILGLAGVAGNGQKELTDVIAGLRKTVGGEMLLEGEDVTNVSASRIRRSGIAYVPEDRMGTGLVGTMNMPDNVILRRFDSDAYCSKGILKDKEIRRATEEMVEHFDIKNAGTGKPVALMSGGNLQKLLLAREVSGQPKVIIAAYPVHGVDIGATEEIHKVLLNERNRGAAILLVSEDLEELQEMSDRVGVISEGRMVDVIGWKDFTYEGIGFLMTGGKNERQTGGETA